MTQPSDSRKTFAWKRKGNIGTSEWGWQMMPSSFTASWLVSLCLISYNLFPKDVTWAEWAEPAPGCNQVEFTQFLVEPGTIAGTGSGIQNVFVGKQRDKRLMSLQCSPQPCNQLLKVICKFLLCIFGAVSSLLWLLSSLIRCPLQV